MQDYKDFVENHFRDEIAEMRADMLEWIGTLPKGNEIFGVNSVVRQKAKKFVKGIPGYLVRQGWIYSRSYSKEHGSHIEFLLKKGTGTTVTVKVSPDRKEMTYYLFHKTPKAENGLIAVKGMGFKPQNFPPELEMMIGHYFEQEQLNNGKEKSD